MRVTSLDLSECENKVVIVVNGILIDCDKLYKSSELKVTPSYLSPALTIQYNAPHFQDCVQRTSCCGG